MASVGTNLVVIDLANSITDWDAPSGQLDTEIYKQETGSYTYQTGKSGIAECTYTRPQNWSAALYPNIYWTMRCDVFPFCELLNTGNTNSGLMLRITDVSGNYTQWHIAGRDTWDGGWKTFALSLADTTNIHSTNGVLSLASVNIITWITDNSNSGNIRIIDNTWVDSVRYGRFIYIYGTSCDFATMAYIDQLTAQYWGILKNLNEVLFLQGELQIGHGAINPTTFISNNETIYCKDSPVDPAGFGIRMRTVADDHASYIEINGLVCKSVGNTYADFYFINNSDQNPIYDVDEFHLNSSTFINMAKVYVGYDIPMTFTKNSFTNVVSVLLYWINAYKCTWDGCGPVYITSTGGDSYLDNCIIKNHDGYGVWTDNFNHITDCTFISNGTDHAVALDGIGDRTFQWENYLTGYAAVDGSTGNEALYITAATGTVTINVGAGYSIPSIRTNGATVIVVAGQVTTTITVKNQDGDPIVGARVYVITESTGTYPSPPLADGTVIFNTLTDVNGQVSDTRSLGSPQPITGWGRDSTSPPPLYKQTPISEVIDNGIGLNLNMLLILDE